MSEIGATFQLRDLAAKVPQSFTDGDWVEAPHIQDSGIRLIQTGNIGLGCFIDASKKFISQSSFEALKCKEIYPGDVLICRLAEPIGRSCFAPNLGERMITSVDVTILRVDTEASDPRFIVYSLNTPESLRRCEIVSGGTTRQRISRSNLGRIKLSVPKRTVQRRIAEILWTLDETIEQTDALIAKYHKIKAGLMHDLFTRGVTPDGKLRPTRDQAPQLYKESPLGWIPKEWKVVTTEHFAAKTPGATTIGPFGSDLLSTDYRGEGVPVIFVRDVKEDAFEWNSSTYVSRNKAQQLAAHAVKSGDILSTKMGLPPCISCRYPSWMEQGVITADIIRLRPDASSVEVRWLSAALNSDAYKRQVQAITAGVTRPKITLSAFRKLLVSCPMKDEQTLVADRLESVSEFISTENLNLIKFREQKHGLVHDLLTGRVRVKVAESEAA
jgi:type I restriction enzyme, S subunit